MIKIVQGNIFEANVEALVNPVNCVGVAGRGLALEFKRRFRSMQDQYEFGCRFGNICVGEVSMVPVPISTSSNLRMIILFPTKQHWRSKSRIEWIEDGLTSLRWEVIMRQIKSIAIPALGCGLGGLNWEDVRPLIVGALEGLDDVEILIYEPQRPEKIWQERAGRE